MSLSENRDIIFIEKEVFLSFSYLEWDTAFFGRPSYGLNVVPSSFGAPAPDKLRGLGEKLQGCFVTAKIETSAPYQIIKMLLDVGFYYVETEVTLKLEAVDSGQNIFSRNNNITVEELFTNEGVPYEIFGQSFSYTRFHTDPFIEEKKADELWISYLKNYSPDENHRLIIARYKGEPAGIILANRMEKQVALFFVAVAEEYRNRQIGTALMEYVKKHFVALEVITGTQIKNIPALNYYIKNGFSKILCTKTVLHYWG